MRQLVEKGFTPETNNVMEQLFSSINDVMNQARSSKIVDGLANFSYNLFVSVNKRFFNTGAWRGLSPLSRAEIKYGWDLIIILANCLSGNYLILHQNFILFANVGYFCLSFNEDSWNISVKAVWFGRIFDSIRRK